MLVLVPIMLGRVHFLVLILLELVNCAGYPRGIKEEMSGSKQLSNPGGLSAGSTHFCIPHRNVQRFRGGLVFKAHRLGVSLSSKLEGNRKEEEA